MKPPRCAVNPVLGREVDYSYAQPANVKKKVVVVGGGPAGLEAARTAAGRGHDVVLFEKEAQVGGLIREASMPPFKTDLKKYLEWSVHMTESCPDIDIRLSTEATPELVAKENADALIIAVGATPNIPAHTCKDKSKVIWVGDLEKESIDIGNSILIVGAGLTGCETALKYLQEGRRVTLIDALPREQLGLGSSPINAYYLFDILEEHNVDLRPDTWLVDVTNDHAVIKRDGKEENLVFDNVILASGMNANADSEFIRELKATVAENYVIGDSNTSHGTLWNAVTSGFDAAMAI